MTIKTLGYAATYANGQLEPFQFLRRDLGKKDILIEISYCGICHSDIHQVKNEWGGSTYPLVPGHEIVGKVIERGKHAKKFQIGDIAGVGCMVNACGRCKSCKNDEQQYCEKHCSFTYNSTEADEKTPTYGGYSSHIVVHEDFALKIPKSAPLARVAPLLCAGITTYSPLKRLQIKKGHKVGVIGLGGLGHMAVKIAAALGAEVTVFSSSAHKKADAKKLKAKHFVQTHDLENIKPFSETFDAIIDTVSAPHPLMQYIELLKRDGTLVMVGISPEEFKIDTSVFLGRKKLTGSLIGGIHETQQMLNFCIKKNLLPEVEIIEPKQINEAFARALLGDVRYRFVIDCSRLRTS